MKIKTFFMAALSMMAATDADAGGATFDADSLLSRAMGLHNASVVLDSHADTPLDFTRGAHFDDDTGKLQVSIDRLHRGGVSAQYLACWVKQGALDDQSRRGAAIRVDELIDSCHAEIARNSAVCGLAVTAADALRLKDEGKIAVFIGVENAYGIGEDAGVLDSYAARGVSYVTLCHTGNNDVCDSSSDKAVLWGGLSPFGREVVKRMNSLGLLIDLSHAAESTFWDVLALSEAPVVCTHSSSKVLCGHDRNLTDRQLRAIADAGGVVQVCPVPEFLCDDKDKATIDDYMRHLLHIIDVAGVDHVGIGTDFDGGGGVPGFNGSDDIVNVTAALLRHGFSDKEIAGILGGNFLRVLARAQALRSGGNAGD